MSLPISSERSECLSDIRPAIGPTIFWRKFLFRLRERMGTLLARPIRVCWWSIQGMKIGKGTSFSTLQVSWPHQVRIGEDCRIEHQVYFHYDGIYKPGPSIVIGNRCFIGFGCEFNITNRIEIGDHCLIASGCKFVDHNHGTAAGALIGGQPCFSSPISLEKDVWIGANSVILAGVTIGPGAIVGAGSVVTRSIPANAVAAGSPARIIRFRGQAKGE